MTYPIGDMLIRIKNAMAAGLHEVSCRHSNFKEAILKVMRDQGYIEDYSVEGLTSAIKNLRIKLRYYQGMPAIQDLQLVSKPGRKVYRKISDLPKHRNGLATVILSTSKGVISDHEARKDENHVGGLVICKIF